MEDFGTVLTVSPHKDAIAINQIGKAKGVEQKVTYFEADWKKKDGFKITGEYEQGSWSLPSGLLRVRV